MKKRTRVLAAVLAVLVLLAAALILNGPKISGWVLRQMYPRRFSGTVSREAEEFALPDSCEPVAMLLMGYPAQDAKPSRLHSQKKPREETVFYGSFSQEEAP